MHAPDDKETCLRTYMELGASRIYGTENRLWEKYQDRLAKETAGFSGDARNLNFVMPKVMTGDSENPYLTHQVLLAHPDDCERIAKRHIRKQPNFTPFLFQSIIATTNNDHWRTQREHLNGVFLPQASLSKIFPTSWARANKCAERLDELRADSGEFGVQMHDFFLHEAQAQLQMALFGMDEEFMERTNQKIRDAFAGTNPDPDFAKDMCMEMMSKVGENPAFASATDPEVVSGEKAVFGPLSKSVELAASELGMNLKDQFGNMMLILFAGHDTTAHTMTWMTYELAKHPEHQARLHAEVDALFAALGGRDMVYEDCEKLPFLTRCVTETLRLWPAVGNGSFRQLQFDDTVTGADGKPVLLEKGTFVQISTWLRHRSPGLWGDDVDTFNPDRDFKGGEIWGDDDHYRGFNPQSERFSPFTFSPRDCLGKNFAQMEMRTIMASVFRKFKFTLSAPYAQWDFEKDGPLENFQGTMGPRDATPYGIKRSKERFKSRQRPLMAMYLEVHQRDTAASAPMQAKL